MSRIVSAHYGKARVPIMKVSRGGQRHELFQAVVSIDTEGERVIDAYTRGDNSAIVATDSMKNLVYILTRDHEIRSPETYARFLGTWLIDHYATIARATVTVEQVAWERLSDHDDAGEQSPTSFRRRGAEQDWARVTCGRDNVLIESGLRELAVLKTTDSAFSGYVVDQYTTLPETEDRILATSIDAEWTSRDGDLDYPAVRARIKELLLDLFVRVRSRSVQDLAYQMGMKVLEECERIDQIALRLPNLHCNLFDLSPFGLTNEDVIYVPTETPHGDLYVTLAR